MKIPAYAKINITLNVLGTRPDGYHEIESYMHAVELHDDVYVHCDPAEIFEITLDPGREDLPADEGNLAWKAAALMHERFHADKAEKISIKIRKRIPVAAGLAGGSADAAAVICALTELWEVSPPYELAAEIGSDVPFCLAVCNGLTAAMATGRGTELAPVMPIDCKVLLATPDIPVPTAAVYKELREEDCAEKFDPSHPGNHLQAPALRLYPEIQETIDWVKSTGASYVQLSGSGPTVFGLFDTDAPQPKYTEPEHTTVHFLNTLTQLVMLEA